MDELNAVPSSTEPLDNPNWTPAQLAEIQAGGVAPMQSNQIAEGGAAAAGEPAAGAAEVDPSGSLAASSASDASTTEPADHADAQVVGGGVDAPSHLLMLDVMLAEIERKIATGVHLFAHEVTAARDHLAKLL